MVTKKTRLISGFAAVLILISMLTVFVIPAVAEANDWEAYETVDANGLVNKLALPDITGYPAGVSAYSVSTRAGMDKIFELVAGGNTLKGVTIYQTADIDMGQKPFLGIGIAGNNNVNNVAHAFAGTFDGNGFTFDNVYVLRNNTNSSDAIINGGALFARTNGAVLKNIGISGGLIVGGERTGAIAGDAVDTSVINCWNAATVVGGYTQGVGGIVGRASGNKTKIVNCYNLGLVFNREKNATGIVGYMEPNYPDAVIQNCYNAGEIVTGMNGYGTAAASADLEGYSIIMGTTYTLETAEKNANNYYIKNRGKIRSVAELIEQNGGVLSDYDESIIASTDAAYGLEESALTDNSEAGLAAKLNAGSLAAGAVDGYDLYFENSEAGYPVLVYAKNGTVKVKRVAHSNINVNGNTWKNSSALFATVSAARDGGWARASSNKLNNLEIGTANDLFVLGLITSYGPYMSTYGNGKITLTADIDMDEMDLCPVEYYVPIASGSTGGTTDASFDGVLDGANHVIYNWKCYASMVLAPPCGGLISLVNTATVKNLGMINAHGIYENKATGGYTYAALLVEREYGQLTMDNCFVTGTLEVVSGTNANNYGGLFSTTWNGVNPQITNCWVDVDLAGASTGKVRAIGKFPVTTNTSNNNYYIADVEPAINKGTTSVDNGSYMNQTKLPTSYSVANGTLAAYLNSVMSQKFVSKNGLTTFADGANNATYLMTTIKRIGSHVIGEEQFVFNANDTVTTPTYEGYELDTTAQGFFTPAANGTFTMPGQGITLYYQQTAPDYSLVEEFIDKFNLYDTSLLTNGAEINKLLGDAEDILAAKNSMTAAEGVDAIRYLLESGDSIKLELVDAYPNLPNYSDKALYEEFKIGKEWAVSSREDWLNIVKDSEVNDFTGYTFHFMNDVDMQSIPIAPVCPTTSAAFKGNIDGHGHVIKNLSINWNLLDGTCVGLIGYANGSTIQNLGIASGDILAYGTINAEAMVGSFIGQGDDVIVRNCWNAATVDSTKGKNGNYGQSTSGIARTRKNSVIDGCYNLGVVKGNSYSGSISGYTQTATKVYNSFATTTPVGGNASFVRYGGTVDILSLVKNSYMVGGNYSLDIVNKSVDANPFKLNADAYSTGELAWVLNQNYEKLAEERTYFTLEDGKTVHGTAKDQVRRITLVADDETVYVYAPANSKYEITAFLGAAYTIANGSTGVVNGNVLSVPNDDVVINVTKNILDFSGMQAALEQYRDGIYDYLVNGAQTKILVETVYSKINNGLYTDQAAIDADTAALNAAYVYAGYPALPSVTDVAEYPDVEGYLISNLQELEFVGKNEALFAADKVLYLNDDITVTSANSAANNLSDLVASIDGKGHTIKGVTFDGQNSWLGAYAGSFIKNLTMDSWQGSNLPWQGALLIYQNNSANLTLDNIKAVNCTAQSDTLNNGLSVLLGTQSNSNGNVNFKNIRIEHCTMDANGRAGNVGFVAGLIQEGTMTAENIYVANNTIRRSANSNSGLVFGEITGKKTIIKNVGIFNNKSADDTISSATLVGCFNEGNVAAPELIIENVLSGDNGTTPCLIYTSNNRGVLTANNVYSDIPMGVAGTVTNSSVVILDKILNASVLYTLNKSVEQKWEIDESGYPAFDTDGAGLPVRVSLDCEKGSYKLYTNSNGNIIGLNDEVFNAADWGYATKEALESAVFTQDTVINEENPCEHEWSYTYKNNWIHTQACGSCDVTKVVVCSPVYIQGENNTHTATCEFCNHAEPEACKITSKVIAPTCDEAQSLVTGCFDCGRVNAKVYNESVPALGHDWSYNHDTATMGAEATHTRTCSVCDAVESGVACTFEDSYTNHTAEAKGYTTYTCVCGYSYDEADADFAHIWDENGVITKYPTYVQTGMTEEECQGTMETTCTICGTTDEVVIAALTGAGIKVNTPDKAEQGDTIEVTLELVNNTGVAGFTVGITYDAAALTLTGITNTGMFGTIQSPDDLTVLDGTFNITVVNISDVAVDGAFVTLTFKVNDDAQDGIYDITAEIVKAPGSVEGDTGASDANGNYVVLGGGAAVVEVNGYIWGDLNDSKDVTLADALYILRYLAQLMTEDDMEKPAAADTNFDDDVTLADALMILRHLAQLYTPPQD